MWLWHSNLAALALNTKGSRADKRATLIGERTGGGAHGGPQLAVRTVESLTDVRVDHYVEVDFNGFVGVVDALGGIELEFMQVYTPEELKEYENRVSLTPNGVALLVSHGARVAVESGAGTRCGYSDEEYVSAGASVAADADDLYTASDLIVKVKEIQVGKGEHAHIRPHHTVFGFNHFESSRELTDAAVKSKATFISFEKVIDEIEAERVVDADVRLQAVRRLPRAVAHAQDGFALGARRVERADLLEEAPRVPDADLRRGHVQQVGHLRHRELHAAGPGDVVPRHFGHLVVTAPDYPHVVLDHPVAELAELPLHLVADPGEQRLLGQPLPLRERGGAEEGAHEGRALHPVPQLHVARLLARDREAVQRVDEVGILDRRAVGTPPVVVNVRIYGMNAVGKVYVVDKVYRLLP